MNDTNDYEKVDKEIEVTEIPELDTAPYRISKPKDFKLSDIRPDDTGMFTSNIAKSKGNRDDADENGNDADNVSSGDADKDNDKPNKKAPKAQKAKKQAKKLNKKVGEAILENNKQRMFALQEKLYAENEQGVVIVFQAMDAAGKDGAIKHVMSGLNPQGTHVTAFKVPTSEEMDHDYLWRINKALPRRGDIGIFNRSHYEEVVVTQLHNLLENSQLPQRVIGKDVWEQRYEQINNWEKYLTQQGYVIVKFFLHISKEEQRERLLDRVKEKEKNWKFSSGDIAEREHWDEYQKLYEEMIQKTSTPHAPWYVIPSDKKWFSRALVSQVVADVLEKMDPQVPELTPEEAAKLDHWREVLESQAKDA